MRELEDLFGNPFWQALGWALLHFVWQGTLVALLLAALLTTLRRASAQARYLLSCAALAVMIALPAATLARSGSDGLLPSPVELKKSAAPPQGSGYAGAIEGTFNTSGAFLPAASAWVRSHFPALQPWLVSAWLLGVLGLSVRFLGGWAAVERLKRVKARPAASDWQAALNRLAARLSVSRPVRLLQSAAVSVPSALGVLRPAVLLPASALTGLTPRQLEAILAHELAHIRRHDYLVNLFQATVETLLFYHPAVWWVSRRVRVERENCCDDLAVAATGSARVYARALADLEEIRLGAPAYLVGGPYGPPSPLALAANGGALWNRISRLLKTSPERSEAPSRSLAGVLTLAALLAMGAATRYSIPGEEMSPLFGESLAAGSEAAAASPGEKSGKKAHGARAKKTEGEQAATTDAVLGGVEGATAGEAIADAVVEADRDQEPAVEAQSVGEGSKKPIPLDRVIAFKVHGVTPEFIAELASLGYTRVDPDDLVSLRIHGVTGESIQKINARWGRLPLEKIVSLKIHDLTPSFAEEMKAAGFSKLDLDDLLSMKIHDVTPEFVRSARAAWPGELDADDILSLKIHGATPQDAEKWKAAGFERPSLEQLTSLKIHGATPEFARAMVAADVQDLDLDAIVAFRIHGVTPRCVEEIRALGYKNPSADDLTALKIHGVSPQDIRAFRAAGYPDISLDDVVRLKIHGITPEELEEENREEKR